MIEILITIKRNISAKKKCWITAILTIILIMNQAACKKMIDIPAPAGTLVENNVYSSNATAIGVLSDLYSHMNNIESFQGNRSIALFTGLSSDEQTLYSGVTNNIYLNYYKNTLSAIIQPPSGSEHWSPLYHCIFKVNAAIEGLNSSTTLSPIIKQQLLGEANFMRAFFYFYLINLFGDVPLAVTSDPKINTLLPCSPKVKVYKQIVTDLKKAKELLSTEYLNETLLSTTTERVRPTKWAAAALLARVYLYTSDYINAEAEATMVINNSSLYSLPVLNDVFLKNSREAIWQLQPTAINFNTRDARTYIIPSTGPTAGANATNPVYISDDLLKSFESGDQRAVYGNWLDTTIYQVSAIMWDTLAYPYKYKINNLNSNINPTTGTANMTEYFMVLRLGEQYLIRAEARALQDNISGAQNDLDAIRIRAGIANTTAGNKNALLTAILHERRVELFSEWGHRWFDLKRTGQVDAVMSVITPIKANGAPWQSYQQLYPLPQSDLNAAPNLKQNIGY